MATANRAYTEVPADTSPDVPYWVNQALGQIDSDVEGLSDKLETAMVWRGTIPANTDLNALTVPGIYYTGGTTNIATLQNLFAAWPGLVLVHPGTAQVQVQEQFVYGSNPRRGYRISASTGVWNVWSNANIYRGALPTGTNIYNMRGPEFAGFWDIPGAALANTLQGPPPAGLDTWLPGHLLVEGGTPGGANLTSMTYKPYGGTRPRKFFTTIKDYQAAEGVDAFHPFEEVATVSMGGGGGGSLAGSVNSYANGVPNEMRLQAFRDAYPKVSTGGKGVVVFRYDHGLNNIKSDLLDLHTYRGVPLHIAMNSRLWDSAIQANDQVTHAEAKAWIAAGLTTFANHSADHKDRNTADGMADTTAGGRKELEAQLGVTIHDFIVPGVTEYNKFEGFGSGYLNSFSDTLFGSLVLANHAFSSGAIGEQHRPLDGVIRQGGRHYTWEAAEWLDIKAQIDKAITTKTALTLMAHPINMGKPGKFTKALAEQVINYVADRVAAGELASMNYLQSHHATL